MFSAFSSAAAKAKAKAFTSTLVRKHFRGLDISQIVTSSRSFPVTARVDLQKALERMVSESPSHKIVGAHEQWGHDTLTFAKLWAEGSHPVLIGPLQYEEVDLGDAQAIRCLKQALWLGHADEMPFAVLLTPDVHYGRSEGIVVEVAVPPGEAGLGFSGKLMARLEKAVAEGRSYRGKVLSLEGERSYSGKANAIRVHRLRAVKRDEIILPEQTIALLERNITEFIRHRAELSRLKLGMKKGLLFYGPPGTGKTHTIHYLASQLPEHTTFLITAEQLGLLGEYMALARLLQPSIVVMEDVDLIARDRGDMRNPCEESLLNKLLNEMDGLREDAAVFFVLTTNRPDNSNPPSPDAPAALTRPSNSRCPTPKAAENSRASTRAASNFLTSSPNSSSNAPTASPPRSSKNSCAALPNRCSMTAQQKLQPTTFAKPSKNSSSPAAPSTPNSSAAPAT